MARKHVNEDIVVGGKTKTPVASFDKKLLIKTALTAVGLVLLVGLVLYLIPPTRPLVNRYLGIASPQTTGPCSGNGKFLDTYSTVVKQKSVDALGGIPKQARSFNNYANDPSCVHVSMVGYYAANDPANALKEYNQLKHLKAQGKTPAERIKDGIDVKQLYNTLKASTAKPEYPYAQG